MRSMSMMTIWISMMMVWTTRKDSGAVQHSPPSFQAIEGLVIGWQLADNHLEYIGIRVVYMEHTEFGIQGYWKSQLQGGVLDIPQI